MDYHLASVTISKLLRIAPMPLPQTRGHSAYFQRFWGKLGFDHSKHWHMRFMCTIQCIWSICHKERIWSLKISYRYVKDRIHLDFLPLC